jgi:hypothetical protein
MKSTYQLYLFPLCALWAALALGQTPVQQFYTPRAIPYDPARLKSYTTAELIDLLSEESIKKNSRPNGIYSVLPPDRQRSGNPPNVDPKKHVELRLDEHATDYALSVEDELASRKAYRELVDVFGKTDDEVQQAWIIDALTRMRSLEVDKALRPFVSEELEDSPYLALKYFAMACDDEALHILNKNYFKYPGSSREWATIVRLFGKCKYKPATMNLVGSVNAMMLELGYESHLSLLAIYPNAAIEFRDPAETQEAWKKYLGARR